MEDKCIGLANPAFIPQVLPDFTLRRGGVGHQLARIVDMIAPDDFGGWIQFFEEGEQWRWLRVVDDDNVGVFDMLLAPQYISVLHIPPSMERFAIWGNALGSTALNNVMHQFGEYERVLGSVFERLHDIPMRAYP